jgi:hypothetical protein
VSKEALAKVVQRAISDGAFRRQLSTDPTGALRGFDLNTTEIAALRSGDSGRLSTLGVDLRMSKAFAMSTNDGTNSTVSNVVSSDLQSGRNSAFDAGVNSSGNSSLNSGVNSSGNSTFNSGVNSGVNSSGNSVLTPADITSGNSSLTSGDGAAGSAAISTGENAGHQVVQWDGTDDQPLGGRNEVVIPGDPAHALGAQTGVGGGASLNDEADQYLTSVNTAQTSGDAEAHNVIISDDGVSGASTPGEAGDGPNIQP